MSKKIFMRTYNSANTFLGGIGINVTTPALLAPLLGISAINIKKFRLIGNDIECRISNNYSTPTNAFNNTNGRFLTYFLDPEGKVTNLGNNSFKTVTNLMSELYFPGIITQTGGTIMQDALGTSLFNIPNCTSLPSALFGNWNGLGKVCRFDSVVSYNGTPATIDVFVGNNVRATVYANTFCQTNNSGGVDADLQAVIDNVNGNVIWV